MIRQRRLRKIANHIEKTFLPGCEVQFCHREKDGRSTWFVIYQGEARTIDHNPHLMKHERLLLRLPGF